VYKQYAGVAVLHMCKKPVNSLNLDMLTSLSTALDKLEASRQCNALIITSVCFFSALTANFKFFILFFMISSFADLTF